MLCFALLAIFSIPLVYGQGTDQENKTQCIYDLSRWCNSMQYSQTGVGMSMISVDYMDSSVFYRTMCITDSEGTNCTRNGSPWFACSANHALTYKGKPLTDIPQGVDDDICNTTYAAFNRLYIQNMSHNVTALNDKLAKELESFHKEMDAMLTQLHKTLGFADRNFWKTFEDGNFPFLEHDSTEPDDTEQIGSKEDSNEVERD